MHGASDFDFDFDSFSERRETGRGLVKLAGVFSATEMENSGSWMSVLTVEVAASLVIPVED